MPVANVRGVSINYEVIGDKGPWLALMPGGRRGYAEFVPLAKQIAAEGFRVLLHDRRNCGASEVVFDDSDAEDAIWAADLHGLLKQLNALPAFIGGSSSGCRMSLLFYLRYRSDVSGLLLFRVTGGEVAAQRLPQNYYTQFIEAAKKGGLEAVTAMEHWRERIEARPANRDVFARLTKERFLEVMEKWRAKFLNGADLPVLGVTDAELASIGVPTIVIPGNDQIHSGPSGRYAAAHIPGAKLHELPITDTGRELVPYEEWAPNEPEITAAFVGLMRGALSQAAAPRRATG